MNRRHLVALLVIGALGCTACGKKDPPPPAAPVTTAVALSGEQIYQQYCAVCHMVDGGGVPNFQPALRGSAIVAGDPARLENVIRAGSAALMDRESEYAAPMPPFGTLSDGEIQSIVAYVRKRFGAADSGRSP